MIEKFDHQVKLGFIGLGRRGRRLLKSLLGMEDVQVCAISDFHEDRLRQSADLIQEAGREAADHYRDYESLLAREDIEGVIIATHWSNHLQVTIAAMNAGKYAACEVGSASSLEECWELVRTSEKTGMHCMLLENCNYGREEMAILNMVKKGLFGELIHCQGGYEHDLRENVVTWGLEQQHYRLLHHLHRNEDNYPTHGLGPLAKCLGINRGNQFLTLTSMASKSAGLRAWSAEHLGHDHPMARTAYTQGDIVTTMIKCAHGETIMLIQDTSLPRPYSRAGRVQGTKGIWMEDNTSIYVEGRSPAHQWEPFAGYRDEYEHPLWKQFIVAGIRGGHGGKDYLCLRGFLDSVARRVAPPIDVYDAAAWLSVSALSAQSIAQGSHPVSFPDFTNGKWLNRGESPKSPYSLNEIIE